MSSEALEAKVAQIQEAYLDDAYGSSFQLKVAAYWPEIMASLAALAVAREREQRLRESQDNAVWAVEIAWEWLAYFALESDEEPDAPLGDVAEALRAARAALVHEPAAATLAEPGEWSRERTLAPGSASAAADEPGETP